jgi:hypothetical protein
MKQGLFVTGVIGWNYVVKSSARVPMSQDLNPCITPVFSVTRSTGVTQVKNYIINYNGSVQFVKYVKAMNQNA